MGLFITKALVERHRGTLGIESGLGDSTDVRVRLPSTPLRLDIAEFSGGAGGVAMTMQ